MTLTHKVATETLYHYSCGACKRWWSVSGGVFTAWVSCPHCATTLATKETKEKPRASR